MPKVIVLMTALVPTIGHHALVNFALNYSAIIFGGPVHLIISSRKKEPISGYERYSAFYYQFQTDCEEGNLEIHSHDDDNAPQNPTDIPEEEFWEYWKNTVKKFVGSVIESDDVVIASETYGLKMAEVLGCKFVPFDINRAMLSVKGTSVRQGLPYSISEVMPEFRSRFQKTITLFGAESCGKTTTAKYLARELDSYYIEEWARPYLETVGKELSPEKMLEIVNGQYALQHTAKSLEPKAFVFQDTDLLSTLGYYRILGYEVPLKLKNFIIGTRSDLYILMKTNIPFEADPLRYGGDVRESDDQFWIDILEEFNCNYVIVDKTEWRDRNRQAVTFVQEKCDFTAIKNFERD